jgi:hypothetical protein
MWKAAEFLANVEPEKFGLFLEQLSGKFLTAVLTMPTIDINKDSFFENIKDENIVKDLNGDETDSSSQVQNNEVGSYASNKNIVWVQTNIGSYQLKDTEKLGDINFTNYNALIGADIIKMGDAKAGIYASIDNKKISQARNSANITSPGVGVFGALFNLFNNKFNAKGRAGIDFNKIKTERKIDAGLKENLVADFSAKTIKAQGEIEFVPGLSIGKIDLSFFANINYAITQNDKFEESYELGNAAALGAGSQSFSKSEADIGVSLKSASPKAAALKSAMNRFNFGARTYIGIILTQKESEYDLYFTGEPEAKMNIEGAKTAEQVLGLNLFASYRFTQRLELGVGLGASFGLDERQSQVSGRLGITFLF